MTLRTNFRKHILLHLSHNIYSAFEKFLTMKSLWWMPSFLWYDEYLMPSASSISDKWNNLKGRSKITVCYELTSELRLTWPWILQSILFCPSMYSELSALHLYYCYIFCTQPGDLIGIQTLHLYKYYFLLHACWTNASLWLQPQEEQFAWKGSFKPKSQGLMELAEEVTEGSKDNVLKYTDLMVETGV